MNNVVDEVLAGAPRYNIKDNGGSSIYSNVQIDLATAVTTAGTPLNKALFDSIKDDLNSRLLTANKTTTAEAQAGTNDTKYMTASKTTDFLNARFHIATGTVSDGGTIPQTSGYTNYFYMVSINTAETGTYEVSTSSGGQFWVKTGLQCSVNQSTRKVTCKIGIGTRVNSSVAPTVTYTSATANYIEFAWG